MRRQCKMLTGIAFAIAGLLAFAAPGLAHTAREPLDTSGLSISPITHGQMSAIARYHNEIVALGLWMAPEDTELDALITFSRDQHARCFWGLMPGSVEDEISPFNECSHAYLAADLAALLRMRTLGIAPEVTNDLVDRVDREMVANAASLTLCAFSATDFNTASPVDPDWHDFLNHTPSLMSVLAVLLLCLALVGLMALKLVGWRDTGSDEGEGLRQARS